MKNFYFAIFSLLVSFSIYAADLKLKQPDTLSVLAYTDFRPISYDNGAGYEGDLIRAVAKIWKVKIKFYPESVYEGIWRIPSRNYSNIDMAMGGLTPLSLRSKEGTTFSVATTHYMQSLLVRKKDFESGRIRSYASFKDTDLKIGVVPGTTGEYFARIRANENHLSPDVIVTYPNEKELLTMLMNGKIAAIARGEIGNDYQASINKQFITIAKKDFDDQFTYAVDKNNPQLLRNLNEAISYLTDQGKITYKEWTVNHDVFNQRAELLIQDSDAFSKR